MQISQNAPRPLIRNGKIRKKIKKDIIQGGLISSEVYVQNISPKLENSAILVHSKTQFFFPNQKRVGVERDVIFSQIFEF